VFVLAGQSNMEGKAQDQLWESQATAAATGEFFAPFRDAANERWVVRDDVWIRFLDRRGPLTLGFGSPKRTGCEFAFGLRVGDAFDEPVLLIKTAWGGRSLNRDFRPPSAGLPDDDALAKELAAAQDRVRKRNEQDGGQRPVPTLADIRSAYGKDYRAMIAEVQDTLANLDTLFPALRGRRPELCGLVWFQGWNDQYGGAEQHYEQNLRHLIEDVRKDLDAPELPFVIGVMGQNGPEPAKGAMLAIQQAQLAVAGDAGPRAVRAVRTDELVDLAAWQLYPRWKERKDEWERTGSDHPYHYLGSAIWYSRIGFAFADAALALQARR